MGSEVSQLSGLEISERPVQVCDLWSLYQATAKATTRYFGLCEDGALSVFKGDAVPGPLWSVSTPLEKCSNNLLKYRHPCVVRYITAWQQRSTWHLATEFVKPLAIELQSQSPLQICIGLNDVLRALVFLHEQAGMSHNDVSIGSVYVTSDGHWKLGGLQYLCPWKEMTTSFLKHARLHRYDKAVDPNEDSHEVLSKVDQYAFAVLVEDVFKGRKDDDVPHLREFKTYCSEKLQHSNPSQRPALSEVLRHDFFNHQFISIYKFLYFLALKTEEEKSEFFSTIMEKLRSFDEEIVARQLGVFLLSRVAMLNQTARKEVIPCVLTPRNDRVSVSEGRGLFSLGVYKEHMKPRLLQLFGVRDSQLRTMLLDHFPKYAHVFTHAELSQSVLPELLLGMKDTDDNLVASTLKCLSELIPILGASTVIGGKRTKIFNDGRPNRHSTSENCKQPLSKSLKDFSCSEQVSQGGDEVSYDSKFILNERPSPVGGESVDEEIVQSNEINVPESESNWSDWETSNRQNVYEEPAFIDTKQIDEKLIINTPAINKPTTDIPASSKERTELLQNAALQAKKKLLDISELDIKTQTGTMIRKSNDEFDFFADMEPVIEKSVAVTVEVSEVSSKLNFDPSDAGEETGWGGDWSDG